MERRKTAGLVPPQSEGISESVEIQLLFGLSALEVINFCS